jgi:MFS family permease
MGIGAMGAAVFLVFTFDALAPLALRSLHVGVSLLGIAIGGIGLGAAIGSIVVGQWGQRFHPFSIMGAGKVLAGGCVALVGAGVIADVHLHAAIWTPVLVAIGVGAAAILVPYGFVLQSETPPGLIGRVSVTGDAVQTILGLSAPPLGAVVAAVFGVGTLFAVAGGTLAVLGLVVYVLRPTLQPIAAPEEPTATEEPASPAHGSVVVGDTSVVAHGVEEEVGGQ